jgi:hypothetical protein
MWIFVGVLLNLFSYLLENSHGNSKIWLAKQYYRQKLVGQAGVS